MRAEQPFAKAILMIAKPDENTNPPPRGRPIPSPPRLPDNDGPLLVVFPSSLAVQEAYFSCLQRLNAWEDDGVPGERYVALSEGVGALHAVIRPPPQPACEWCHDTGRLNDDVVCLRDCEAARRYR